MLRQAPLEELQAKLPKYVRERIGSLRNYDSDHYLGDSVSLCAACFSTAGRVNGRLK